ncbi:thioesterase [Pseudovibrio flavus]|uniref:thioesterase n=1 Tax=Pseudovibrio flavus TaxID=2529854 RepID=UPI00211C1BD0|nr:thioesterase [Pseudovibrio flavus]
MTGFSESIVGARRVRHVRFHAELRVAALIKVRSYVAFDGPHMLCVVHEMTEGSTGEVAATAIDGYTPNPSAAKQLRSRFQEFEDSMSAKAAPRGITPTPYAGRPTPESLMESGAFITGRSTILPRDAGPEGRADDAFLTGFLSDASAHTWERTPMTTEWLDENMFGRVVLEKKLSWVSPLKVGESLYNLSAFTSVQENTFNIRDYIFEAKTNRFIAICDSVFLAMDLDKRSMVSLSKEHREALLALQVQGV